jgi:hypothetical protein
LNENKFSFSSISLKATIVHTVSYFVIGLLALTFLDYSTKFADPIVAGMFRQTDHPLVAAGPLFQILRGFLFGVAFYFLREIIFARKNGWLILWLVLIIVGVISPFGAAPSSIEGMVYTVLPSWFHIVGLPEIIVQSGLLAFLTHYWVNHPEKKWLNWVFGIAFILTILMSSLGILAALGMLPTSG